MFSVYVLKHSDTNEIYIGKTSNLARRLAEHNASKQRATHRVCGKWILVYAEAYRSEEDASKREKRLKQHGRAKQEIMKRAENSLKDWNQKVVLGTAVYSVCVSECGIRQIQSGVQHSLSMERASEMKATSVIFISERANIGGEDVLKYKFQCRAEHQCEKRCTAFLTGM